MSADLPLIAPAVLREIEAWVDLGVTLDEAIQVVVANTLVPHITELVERRQTVRKGISERAEEKEITRSALESTISRVMEMKSRGLSSPEVARMLGISSWSVGQIYGNERRRNATRNLAKIVEMRLDGASYPEIAGIINSDAGHVRLVVAEAFRSKIKFRHARQNEVTMCESLG